MFVVFDLDGTLANIDHRLHFVRDGNKDWKGFFEACSADTIVSHVANSLRAHQAACHRVEIWSGRSVSVVDKTRRWLDANGINHRKLTRMRPTNDYTKDSELKRQWAQEDRPDLVYDDRQSVVDMWRSEGIPCFQVAPNWEKERIIPGGELILLIGPSGAGKSYHAKLFSGQKVLSSDEMRHEMCGDFKDQTRNKDVFEAIGRIARARMSCGLQAVIDATHLHRKDRLNAVSWAPEGCPVTYLVFDRPMAEKIRDGGWRNEVILEKSGLPLMEKHAQSFAQQLDNILRGDDLPQVTVRDMRL